MHHTIDRLKALRCACQRAANYAKQLELRESSLHHPSWEQLQVLSKNLHDAQDALDRLDETTYPRMATRTNAHQPRDDDHAE